MAAKKQLREVEVDGDVYHVDDSRTSDWKTFELCGVLADGKSSVFEQMNAAFELIEHTTDATKAQIVDKFGGDEASPQDVAQYAIKLVGEITSKN